MTKATAQSFGGARPKQLPGVPAVTISSAVQQAGQKVGFAGQATHGGAAGPCVPGVDRSGQQLPLPSPTFADVAGAGLHRPRLDS